MQYKYLKSINLRNKYINHLKNSKKIEGTAPGSEEFSDDFFV